jgi:hypothetical protein
MGNPSYVNGKSCLSDTSVFAKIDNFSPATFNSLRAIAIDAHMSMTQVCPTCHRKTSGIQGITKFCNGFKGIVPINI